MVKGIAWVNVEVPVEQLDDLKALIASADLRDIAVTRVGWPRGHKYRAQLRITGDPKRVAAARLVIIDAEFLRSAVIESGER